MTRAPGTLVDTVLSCIVTSIALAIAATGVALVTASSVRVSTEAAVIAEIARLDGLLVEYSGRVAQPDGTASGSGGPSGRGLRVPYLDGDPAREIVISWAEEVVVTAGGRTHRFGSLQLVAAELVTDPFPLMRLVVRGQGRDWTLVAPLGGFVPQ